MTKRIFIAIPLSTSICAAVERVQMSVRKHMKKSDITWSAPEQSHVTLHFLGDISQEQLDGVLDAIDQLNLPRQFSLFLQSVDAFPQKKRPKTIYLETSTHPWLFRLHQALADALLEQGLSIKQRRFQPHVTLGRVKKQSEVLQPDKVLVPKEEILVRTITVFESVSKEGRYEHIPIKSFSLDTYDSMD